MLKGLQFDERLKTDEFISERVDKNKFMNYVESLESFEKINKNKNKLSEEDKSEEPSINSEKEKDETKSNESKELKFKKIPPVRMNNFSKAELTQISSQIKFNKMTIMIILNF